MPQFARYLIAGLFCAGLEYACFLLLHHDANWGLVGANTIAYGTGLLSSFILNKIWVFGGQQQNKTFYQLLSYCLLALFNYAIGTWLLVNLVKSYGVLPWLAKGLSMSAIVVWNFLIYKKVIYR